MRLEAPAAQCWRPLYDILLSWGQAPPPTGDMLTKFPFPFSQRLAFIFCFLRHHQSTPPGADICSLAPGGRRILLLPRGTPWIKSVYEVYGYTEAGAAQWQTAWPEIPVRGSIPTLSNESLQPPFFHPFHATCLLPFFRFFNHDLWSFSPPLSE